MQSAKCRMKTMRVTGISLCTLHFALCTFFLSGCGYSRNGSEPVGGYQWHSLYREDIKTVAVPIFQNKDYRRGEEFQLTKALVTQIEAKTPYKVVAREKADTILEGEITSVKVRRLSNNPRTAIPQENLYVVVM